MQNARLWEKEQEQPKINQHYGGNAKPKKTIAFVSMGVTGVMGVMGVTAAHEIELQGSAQGCLKFDLGILFLKSLRVVSCQAKYHEVVMDRSRWCRCAYHRLQSLIPIGMIQRRFRD